MKREPFLHEVSSTRLDLTQYSQWSDANVHDHAYFVNVNLESTGILEVSFLYLYLMIHVIKRCS